MLRLKIIAPNQTEICKADGTIVFFSYETPVAAFIPDKGFVRTSTKYSVTTSRHINQWLADNAFIKQHQVSTVKQSEIEALV